MDINYLRKNNLIILECISGSRAYGLETPESDTDIKGVFLLPKKDFYGLDYTPQVSNETNDIVFYEFSRFMQLLSMNNPNILELLNTPKPSIIFKHRFLNKIKSELILSKLCKNTFGRFAISQIKKAKGLKKKIVNPMNKERKTVLSFCYVNYNKNSISLEKYLQHNQWQQQNCGLTKITHMKNVYGLHHSKEINYAGIIRNSDSNDISLSSIPKDQEQQVLMYFNKDGYSKYCKEYKEYWQWVKNRNQARYENTQSHGKNYDAKNMMHTFRLLEMAIEIAQQNQVNVKRSNRDFLLSTKSGSYEYEDLLIMANERQVQMEKAFEQSILPDSPNLETINEITYRIRERFYKDDE
ncbi:MAG: nucleotidyltransferase domain-containing protein [Alcanivoracaceae bacterium]|nr:nucleotidyltransferase domain-containing protein [Alcanivoracaceae bacterium]